MSIKILDKSAKIEGENAILTETTERTLTPYQLEDEIGALRREKKRLLEQNKRIIEEYEDAEKREVELLELREQLRNSVREDNEDGIVDIEKIEEA